MHTHTHTLVFHKFGLSVVKREDCGVGWGWVTSPHLIIICHATASYLIKISGLRGHRRVESEIWRNRAGGWVNKPSGVGRRRRRRKRETAGSGRVVGG